MGDDRPQTESESKAALDIPEDAYNVITWFQNAMVFEHQNIAAKRNQEHFDDLSALRQQAMSNLVNTCNIVNNAAASAFASGVNGFGQIELGKAESTVSPDIPGSGNMAPISPVFPPNSVSAEDIVAAFIKAGVVKVPAS